MSDDDENDFEKTQIYLAPGRQQPQAPRRSSTTEQENVLRQAKRALEGQAGVLSAAQIGERLRVLMDLSVADPEAEVKRITGAAGKTCALTRANLEDVFVLATRGNGT